MAWHFLNIGKANVEIDRLNAEVLKLTSERDAAKTALESNTSEVVTQAEGLQTQLTAATSTITGLQGQVGTLTASVAAKDADLVTVRAELATAKDTIANPSAQIVKIASVKAAEITGAQGQPPVITTPAATPAAVKAEAAGLFGLAKVQAAIKAQISQTK
jgi:chromosome segregation ATPase